MSAAAPVSLDTDQAATIGIVVIVAILLAGALISFILTKIVWRIVTIVVVVVLAGIVYGQRASIESHAKNCDASFFGSHVTPSNATVRKHCQQVTNH